MKLSDIYETCTAQKEILAAQDTGLKRALLQELPDVKTHALVVSGIRRCGKSTLLRQFVKRSKKNFFYLNFDDLRLADFTHADYFLLDRIIADSGSSLLFFDEIQSALHWELYVRQKLDEGYQVVITGSNASLLSRELGTHLTGRHISKELFPFSYREFCSFFKLKAGRESFDSYLEKGGFPEYLKIGNTEILTQLQSDILYRDIAVRYGIRDVSSLRRLYVYLASNPGQKVSPSKLCNMAGVKSPATVLDYFSHFEEAYLIHILPCFSWSIKAQSLAPKKVYIADPGMIKTSSVSFTANYGIQLENFVYNNLRLKTNDIFYYTDKSGAECDFILQPHEQVQCIQVCWELSTENQDREINGLVTAMDFFNQKKALF